MSNPSTPATVFICCSIFQAEVEALRQTNWPDIAIRYQTSMLHMQPDRLAERLDTVVGKELKEGNRVLLIYGDCCLQITALESRPGVARIRGNNCCEMLLGHDEYRRLSHDGVFFLIHEWVGRWREVFTNQLGLNKENATGLMRDMHRKLVYLDTGVVPVPEKTLNECAAYCGLPWEIRPVTLDMLRSAITEAMTRLEVAGVTQ